MPPLIIRSPARLRHLASRGASKEPTGLSCHCRSNPVFRPGTPNVDCIGSPISGDAGSAAISHNVRCGISDFDMQDTT